jgi:hypothetical protein
MSIQVICFFSFENRFFEEHVMTEIISGEEGSRVRQVLLRAWASAAFRGQHYRQTMLVGGMGCR